MNNKKNLALFITLLLLLPATAFSQSFEKNCSAVVQKVFDRIYQEEFGMDIAFDIDEEIYGNDTPVLNNIACSQFESLATVILGVQKKFGPYLIYPQHLTVNMVNKDSNAYNLAGHLNLPKVLFMYNKNFQELTKHPKFNIPVWAHEYGHSIFSQMMQRVSPEWLGLSKIINNYKNALHDFTNKHNPLIRKCKADFAKLQSQGYTAPQAEQKLFETCTAPIKKLRAQVAAELAYQEKLIAPYTAISFAAGSYNEFYADVIAVALLGDPSAISDSLHRSGLKYHRSAQGSIGRDFDNRKNDLDALEILHPNHVDHEIHNLLSAARRHIWKYYLSNPLYNKNPGLMLQLIFKATAGEVLSFTTQLKKTPEYMTLLTLPEEHLTPEYKAIIKDLVIEMNSRLIDAIEKQFKTFK